MKRFFVIFALCCMLVNMIPNAFLSAVPVRAEESGGSGETEEHAYPAEDPGEAEENADPLPGPDDEAEEAVAVLTAVNVNAAETVHLTVGEKVYYGTYSTNRFSVDGKPAYCLEPLKATPESGSYEAEMLETGDLRKGLYYAYGGPGHSAYVEKFGYLGSGEGYDENREYCMSHCILSYLYSGSPDAFTGLTDSEAQMLMAHIGQMMSMPDPPEAFCAFVFGTGSGQAMGGSGKDRTGMLELYKESDRTDWTEGNPCYSLKGAVFGVYSPGAQAPLYEITTDENGYGRIEELPIGTYEIAEIKSPEGFALDKARYTVTVGDGEVCRYRCVDQAQNHPLETVLIKIDSETGEQSAQGSGSLAGAEFEVEWYAGYYESDPAADGITARKSWILRTDDKGRLLLSDEAKVSWGEFFRNSSGEITLPLGTAVIRETKAPEGYLLNDEVLVRQITPSGDGATDTLYQTPEVPEQVIRGDLQIVKFLGSEDDEEDQKTPLEGIVFTVTSKTTGEKIRITTDENGYASTARGDGERGGLVFDTYVVSETETPEGLEPVGDFEITISEEGSTLYYILENREILSPVRLIKTDAETGRTVPLAGAGFRLLDAEKEPIIMEVRYPSGEACEIFCTDESGSLVLPEKLPPGTYYFQEAEAPYGYLLEEGLLEFTITEGHDWEEPFTVVFPDRPAKGRICIEKTDAETEEPLAGTVFEIRAGEDITAPDGTILLGAGETAGTLTTGEDGRAQSDELFLGKYEITETAQTPGYVRSTDVYEAELVYKDQTTPVVTETVKISNAPTVLVIDKKESSSEKRLEGAEFTVRTKDGAAEEFCETYTTDENGRIEIRGLLPGEYYVQETKAPEGYLADVRVFSVTVDETGRIDGEERAVITVENMKKPETAVMSGDDTGIFGMTALLAACSPLLVIAALAKRRGRKALSVPDCRAGERLPR